MKGNLRATQGIRSAGALLGVALLSIGAAGIHGETITVGKQIWELDHKGDESDLTAGNIAIDTSGDSVAAEGTLTISGGVPAVDQVLTLGSRAYIMKASASGAGEITIGGNEEAMIDNIVAAIAGDANNGVHVEVTAVKGSSTTMVATAIIPGVAGNSIASTDTMDSTAWGDTTLGDTTAGVDIVAADLIVAVAAALLASEQLDAYAITGKGVLIADRAPAGSPKATTETLTGGGNGWDTTETFGYFDPITGTPEATITNRAATAAEVTAGVMGFCFGAVPRAWIVAVRTAAGVVKAVDAVVTLQGNTLLVTNAGGTDFASTDIVTITAGF
jgi:hypothetical protein